MRNSVIFHGFRKVLIERYGKEQAKRLWKEADAVHNQLRKRYSNLDRDSKMMILPAAALYTVLRKHEPDNALPMLKEYGTHVGSKIAGIIHCVTSVPGIPKLLWRNMPSLMRKMSSPEAGYTRKIVSETDQLVAVDILSCPLHNAAKRIGMEEVATVVCAMDKAYMTGFKYIDYTRTTSVAEGEACCDYRLSYNVEKK